MIEVVNNSFRKYYFIYLLPVIFISVLLLVFNLSLIQIAVFAFFYLWNLVLQTKSLREQFLQKKMRFSFIRQLINFDIILLKIFRNQYVTKFFQVIIFSVLIFFLFGKNSAAFVFAGACSLEIISLLVSRVEKSKQTLP